MISGAWQPVLVVACWLVVLRHARHAPQRQHLPLSRPTPERFGPPANKRGDTASRRHSRMLRIILPPQVPEPSARQFSYADQSTAQKSPLFGDQWSRNATSHHDAGNSDAVRKMLASEPGTPRPEGCEQITTPHCSLRRLAGYILNFRPSFRLLGLSRRPGWE